jgi:hypothetical protein
MGMLVGEGQKVREGKERPKSRGREREIKPQKDQWLLGSGEITEEHWETDGYVEYVPCFDTMFSYNCL